MHYEEFQPSPPLDEFIQLIWVMESESPEDHFPRERIMPDGIVELVIHFRRPFYTFRADGTRYLQTRAFAISQMRQFIEIESRGDVGFIAARFFPWGAFHFFDTPIKDFLDDAIDIEKVWPGHVQVLLDGIKGAPDHQSRKARLETFLLDRLAENKWTDDRVDRAIKMIRQSGGQRPLREISQTIQLNERQLQRHFLNTVGTTPKVFARVSRFLHLCAHLSDYRDKSLTELTYACGFFDQAHFIKEFKQFSGFTPKRFFDQANIGFAEI